MFIASILFLPLISGSITRLGLSWTW